MTAAATAARLDDRHDDRRTLGSIEVEGMPCEGELVIDVAPSWWDGAFVPLVAVSPDDCDGAPVVANDRTGLGADASDFYPCGTSWLRFTAEDACGNAESCLVIVRVAPPEEPASVGPVLRVGRGAGGTPELDWSPAGAPAPETRHAVLRATGPPHPPLAIVGLVTETRWAETDSDPVLILYVVRAIACDGRLSAD